MAKMIVTDALIRLMHKEGLFVCYADKGKQLEVFKCPDPTLHPRKLEKVGTLEVNGPCVDYDSLMSLVRAAKPAA
jgi:hypothetical protein